MKIDVSVVKTILEQIKEFFVFMANNEKRRLYYVVPLNLSSPYAYQHSSIRDVATVSDVLDLIQFFKDLTPKKALFSQLAKNTLEDYGRIYKKKDFHHLPDGNIGDLGFYLLALNKCERVFPSSLPHNADQLKRDLLNEIINRQRENGSFEIFFDPNLRPYEKGSEAFYLPEAMIGLISTLEQKNSDRVERALQKAMDYLCNEKILKRNMASDTAIFYSNWQLQLLYHWIKSQSNKKENLFTQELSHMQAIIKALKQTPFANTSFGPGNATVEVACFMEGLTHALAIDQLLGLQTDSDWIHEQVQRAIDFLNRVQKEHRKSVHGGFVHSLGSHEARVDVAGHVFCGLSVYLTR